MTEENTENNQEAIIKKTDNKKRKIKKKKTSEVTTHTSNTISLDDINEGKEDNEKSANRNLSLENIKKTLRNLFLISFSLGVVVIWQASGVQAIFLASIIMFVYLYLGGRKATTVSSKAVLADSMYYLGFLFTFVALVFVLYDLGTGKIIKIEDAVGQMGVAILTTVIGMVVRIYYTQFESITSEPDTEAINTLGELSSKLIEATNNLENVSQNSSKALKDFQEKNSKVMQDFTKNLSKLDLTVPTNQMTKLSDTITSLNNITLNLEEYADRSKQKMETAESKLSGFDVSIDKVNSQIEKVKDVSADITELNDLVDEAKKDTKNVVDNAKNELKKVTDNVNIKIGTAARDINNSVTQMANQINKIEEQTGKLSTRLKKAVSDVVDFLKGNK